MDLICCIFLVVPILVTHGSPAVHTGCTEQSQNGISRCTNIADSGIEMSRSLPDQQTNSIAPAADQARGILNDRTWRWNRKSLVPLMIGMTVKALFVLAVSLIVLTIMGSISIFASKISLAISGFMFLKRYFSKDSSSGGFAGLNPLGFPHATLSHHDYLGPSSKIAWNPPHGRYIEQENKILQGLSDYADKTGTAQQQVHHS